MTIRERRDQAATALGTMIGRASVHLGMAHHVHRIATHVLDHYGAPIPVTKPAAPEVTQGRSRHGDRSGPDAPPPQIPGKRAGQSHDHF